MLNIKAQYPKRIICLTEEFTETLYLLGREDLIVGISGFTVRPPQARKTKPKVCTFIEANYEKIYSLKPDLIFAFSDLQAEIVKELIKNGMNVFCFNQRSVEDILSMMRMIGAVIGENKKAEKLVNSIQKKLEIIYKVSQKIKKKPKVYFEEWDEPMISGIQWVEEIIEICGGETIFPELRRCSLAKDRFVKSEDIIERNPDIILASWCGKGVKINKIRSRLGWESINAVKNNKIYEIKSSVILQPGPASLTDGVKIIYEIIQSHIS